MCLRKEQIKNLNLKIQKFFIYNSTDSSSLMLSICSRTPRKYRHVTYDFVMQIDPNDISFTLYGSFLLK